MKRTLVFLSVIALCGGALPASADSGQAYDQVTKFQPNTDFATLEPGDFASDWQTASAPAPEQPKHGGMFGKMRDAVSQAQGAMAAFHNGLAESHYVAGSKERVDLPAQQTATITDCAARTITHLDLKAQTYYVVSMDQPQTPQRPSSGGHSAPGPTPTDDGTKIAITIANASLGPKSVFGNHASGYKSDITMVTTKPNGDSSTGRMNLKEYVSGQPHSWLNCAAARTASAGGMMSALSGYTEIMRAIGNRKDSRFSFSSSGPAMPGTLAYFEAFQLSGGDSGAHQAQGQGGNFSVVIERDKIRTIAPNDSVFFVPAGFTKVNAP